MGTFHEYFFLVLCKTPEVIIYPHDPNDHIQSLTVMEMMNMNKQFFFTITFFIRKLTMPVLYISNFSIYGTQLYDLGPFCTY